MSRPAKGARLVLKQDRRRGTALWIIRDGEKRISTGAAAGEVAAAEAALRRYLGEKAVTGPAPVEPVVFDALLLYLDNMVEGQARPDEVKRRLARLQAFFGPMKIAELKPSDFQLYARERGSGARRELEDLRAALRYAWKNRLVAAPVPVELPDAPPPRERWLTRSEMARLLWAAWTLRQGYPVVDETGAPVLDAAGDPVLKPTGRRVAQHIARFILFALYSASRAGVVVDARMSAEKAKGRAADPTRGIEAEPNHGYVDLRQGVFYRKHPGAAQTKKRARAIPLPARLLAHLRRWERKGISKSAVIEFNGAPVTKINKAFRAARAAAGLGDDVVPHTLRHTAVSWAMMNGGDPYAIARFADMTLEVLDEVYGHLSPAFLAAGGEAIARSAAPRLRPETGRKEGVLSGLSGSKRAERPARSTVVVG